MKKIMLSLPIFLSGSLIDVETTGVDPKYDRVCVFGCITGNRLIQLLFHPKDPLFYFPSAIIELGLRRPFYAFHKQFEERFLETKIEHELYLDFHEKKSNSVKIIGLTDQDPLIDSSYVPIAYDLGHYGKILAHNKVCLLSELSMLTTRFIKYQIDHFNV